MAAPTDKELLDFAKTLSDIPIKLLCAGCSRFLGLDAFKVQCCDQTICAICVDAIKKPKGTCPVCEFSSLEFSNVGPHKAMRLTARAHLKGEWAKHQKVLQAQQEAARQAQEEEAAALAEPPEPEPIEDFDEDLVVGAVATDETQNEASADRTEGIPQRNGSASDLGEQDMDIDPSDNGEPSHQQDPEPAQQLDDAPQESDKGSQHQSDDQYNSQNAQNDQQQYSNMGGFNNMAQMGWNPNMYNAMMANNPMMANQMAYQNMLMMNNPMLAYQMNNQMGMGYGGYGNNNWSGDMNYGYNNDYSYQDNPNQRGRGGHRGRRANYRGGTGRNQFTRNPDAFVQGQPGIPTGPKAMSRDVHSTRHNNETRPVASAKTPTASFEEPSAPAISDKPIDDEAGQADVDLIEDQEATKVSNERIADQEEAYENADEVDYGGSEIDYSEESVFKIQTVNSSVQAADEPRSLDNVDPSEHVDSYREYSHEYDEAYHNDTRNYDDMAGVPTGPAASHSQPASIGSGMIGAPTGPRAMRNGQAPRGGRGGFPPRGGRFQAPMGPSRSSSNAYVTRRRSSTPFHYKLHNPFVRSPARPRLPLYRHQDNPIDPPTHHESSEVSRHRSRRHRSRSYSPKRDRSRSRERSSSHRRHRHRKSRSPEDYDSRRERRSHRSSKDKHRSRHGRDRDDTPDRDHDRHSSRRASKSVKEAVFDPPSGPRASLSSRITSSSTPIIPTGPKSTTAPREFQIKDRSKRSAMENAIRDERPDLDAHAVERETRNRERMLKEQERRGSGSLATNGHSSHHSRKRGRDDDDNNNGESNFHFSSKRRTARGSAGGGGSGSGDSSLSRRVTGYVEDGDGMRASRIEKEREAARWA